MLMGPICLLIYRSDLNSQSASGVQPYLDEADKDREDDEQNDCVSGTESVGKVVVVLGPSLRCHRHHAH